MVEDRLDEIPQVKSGVATWRRPWLGSKAKHLKALFMLDFLGTNRAFQLFALLRKKRLSCLTGSRISQVLGWPREILKLLELAHQFQKPWDAHAGDQLQRFEYMLFCTYVELLRLNPHVRQSHIVLSSAFSPYSKSSKHIFIREGGNDQCHRNKGQGYKTTASFAALALAEKSWL